MLRESTPHQLVIEHPTAIENLSTIRLTWQKPDLRKVPAIFIWLAYINDARRATWAALIDEFHRRVCDALRLIVNRLRCIDPSQTHIDFMMQPEAQVDIQPQRVAVHDPNYFRFVLKHGSTPN